LRIAHRAGVLALSVSVVGALVAALPASVQSGDEDVRGRPSRATASTRGLELQVFGSRVAIGPSRAEISTRPAATARAAGVTTAGRTVATTRIGGDNKRKADNACSPQLVLFELVDVQMACAEVRVQTLPPLFTADYPVHTGAALLPPQERAAAGEPRAVENGGPQALGRASVARVEVRGGDLLRSAMTRLGSLGAGDPVTPGATLIDQLLGAVERATRLVSIKVVPSLAQANTDARSVVSLAEGGGGEIDLLPGAAPGDAPLLSVVITGAQSKSAFDRETARAAPGFEPAKATIRLGLPIAGPDVTELPVHPGSPVTLLAGTPLETTVSVGGGRNVTREDGSVGSVGDGVRVRMLSGVKGGIDLRMGHAESAVGGPATATDEVRLWPWGVAASLALAVSLFLLALVARARRTTASPRAHARVPRSPASS
jgi:hypothetical protein